MFFGLPDQVMVRSRAARKSSLLWPASPQPTSVIMIEHSGWLFAKAKSESNCVFTSSTGVLGPPGLVIYVEAPNQKNSLFVWERDYGSLD